jgi:Restriction endonuclease XhoI
MTAGIPNYEAAFEVAVRRFWAVREEQTESNRLRGAVDVGTRGAVTGGQHLNEIRDVLHQVLQDAGLPRHLGSNRLPGYYRGSKNWDSVVTYRGSVLAIIELKSQVGSFTKNQNNRIEEMVGQALDIWRAARESLLGQVRPWFGYVMLLEDSPASHTRSRSTTLDGFPPDAAFARASAIERYRLAFERLRIERDMDAVCLAVSERGSRSVTYPDPTMSFQAFASALYARVIEIRGQLG